VIEGVSMAEVNRIEFAFNDPEKIVMLIEEIDNEIMSINNSSYRAKGSFCISEKVVCLKIRRSVLYERLCDLLGSLEDG
jgi:hypothetical protein